MAEKIEKRMIPAYIGFNALISFINVLRDTGIPLKIDRSVLPKASGSQYSSMLAALRFLGLVDDSDKPTQKMHTLVKAADNNRKEHFEAMLKESYTFIFSDPEFHIDKATGNQVAEKFRAQDVSGSTVSKCMNFFLALAEAAGVKVSPHVKAPPVPRTTGKRPAKGRKKAEKAESDGEGAGDDGVLPDAEPGYMRITIPLHGMGDGALYLPDGLTPRQRAYALKITKFLLDNYWMDDDTQEAIEQLEKE